MTKEEIRKVLECCSSPEYRCNECPIDQKKKDDCECGTFGMGEALALIRELTEEVADLKAIAEQYQKQFEEAKADTVREMQEKLHAREVRYGNITFKVVPIDDIDQIAEEMIGETK